MLGPQQEIAARRLYVPPLPPHGVRLRRLPMVYHFELFSLRWFEAAQASHGYKFKLLSLNTLYTLQRVAVVLSLERGQGNANVARC